MPNISILADMRSEIMAILPDYFAWMLQSALALDELGAIRPGASARTSGSVAVIPVHGPIFPRGGLLADFFGGTSAESLALSARQAAGDAAVSAVVLDVNSPGGSVGGITEAAEAIRELAARKPVVGIANHIAASAAYWLVSQSSRLMVTPSGEVGSIGVFAAHQDISAALEQMGVKINLIAAGKYKTEGNPYEPLGDEARAAIQSRVDQYYDLFVKDVARGRGVRASDVRAGFGEGRMVGAKDATVAGMADSIGTLDDAIKLATSLVGKQGRSATAELEWRQRRARAMAQE